ncbi:MAG TPA: hypothetical protein G4O17_02575 [Dehalococcoidia bacterium]|jgi:hypothetical protein|nr:hypothetical protein [Dehalococcoidia bacterium]
MKSIEERKIALISRIHQLKRELDSLKQPQYTRLSVNVGTGSDRHLRSDQYDGRWQW